MVKKILVADDEKNMRWILGKNLSDEGFAVIEAQDGEIAFRMFVDDEPDMVILDYKMPAIDGMEVLRRIRVINPKVPVIMVTAHGSTDAAVEAMKLGAVDYISKPYDMEELKMTVRKALKIENLENEVEYLKARMTENSDGTIIGKSRNIMDIFDLIGKVANTLATVLVTGESGTGKELVASAIHNKSARKDKPYIKVNCGAIPETLLESELFGYEKGAFTGAQNRKAGRFDRAQGGTLFLDEIGELPLALQVKLLRVLQEREFERVGGTEVIKADVRIIAATNRDLGQMVEEGHFREDLMYRLNVIPIHVPALRERREDIDLLVDFFIGKYAKNMNKEIDNMNKETLKILKQYDFPGNIRELENMIERAVILSTDGKINVAQLPKEAVKAAFSFRSNTFILPEEGISLKEIEKSFVSQALGKAKGNQTHAAKLLDISRHALIYKMDKYKLQH